MEQTSCVPLLPPVTIEKYQESLQHLQRYQTELPNNEICFRFLDGAKVPINPNRKYISESLKRSHVRNLQFENALFDDSSWTNSVFENVHFTDTPFINSNASYCNFAECDFTYKLNNDNIRGSNFSYANLVKSNFNHTQVKNSTFDNVTFIKCTFTESVVEESTFEGSIFENCTLKKVDLSNLNLDFAEFKNCVMSDVTLPFFHLPYIYGGIKYLYNSNEKVWVSACDIQEGKITANEYIALLPDLINYYSYYNEYFPLANIYAAQGDYDKAFAALDLGIESSEQSQNFRMLKFYCKLAAGFDFIDYATCQKLYEKIYNYHSFKKLTPYAAKDYFAQLGEIRHLLLFNDSNKSTFEIYLKTNVDSTESDKLGILLSQIEKLICVYPKESVIYSVELKHSCPWDVLLKFIINNKEYITFIACSITAILGNANTYIESIDNLKRGFALLKNKCKPASGQNAKIEKLEEERIQSEIENNKAQANYYRALTSGIPYLSDNSAECIPLTIEEAYALEEQLVKTVEEANNILAKYKIKAHLVFQNLT